MQDKDHSPYRAEIFEFLNTPAPQNTGEEHKFHRSQTNKTPAQ